MNMFKDKEACEAAYATCKIDSAKCEIELDPYVKSYLRPYQDDYSEYIRLIVYFIANVVILGIFWTTDQARTRNLIPQILGITEMTIPFFVHLIKFFYHGDPYCGAIWGALIFFVVGYVGKNCHAPCTKEYFASCVCCIVFGAARIWNGYIMAKYCAAWDIILFAVFFGYLLPISRDQAGNNGAGNGGGGGAALKATKKSDSTENSPLIQGTSKTGNPTNPKGGNSGNFGGRVKKRERKNEIRCVTLSPKTFEEHLAKFMQFIAVSNLGRVCQLLAAGINVNSTDSPQTQNTALNYATTFASNEIDKTLCESGANVNAQNNQNDTPLHDAVCRETESIIKILLEFGADSLITTSNGESAVDFAEKRAPELLSMFNSVAQVVHRTLSVDSMEFNRSSIISTDTAPLFSNSEKVTLGKIESWTGLIWPQPHYLKSDSSEFIMKIPIYHRLMVYFNGCGDDEPRRIMQVVQTFIPYLTALSLEIECRGHKVSDSELDGRIMCGIFEDGERPGAYALDIRPNGIQQMGNDYACIRHGFAALVQFLPIFRISESGRKPSTSSSIINGFMNGNLSSISLTEGLCESSLSVIPCLSIRDYPDLTVRAIYQDFSGCKMLNVDTVLQLFNRLSYCKANFFFVNFEIQTISKLTKKKFNLFCFYICI